MTQVNQSSTAGRPGSYATVNGSVNFEVNRDLKPSFPVNSLANRMPDMDVSSCPGTSGEPYDSSNFDVLGRAYYIEARRGFGGNRAAAARRVFSPCPHPGSGALGTSAPAAGTGRPS